MLHDLHRLWSKELCSQQQLFKLLELVTYWDSCKWVSYEDLCNKGNKTTTISSLIGYWSECSTVDWYFGIGQGSGKILYTYNHLIID